MEQARANDTVTISYDGLLANGEIFESAEDTGPLRFVIGTGTVLPAFEQAVLGMSPNETKTIRLGAKEAFGLRNDDLVIEVPRSTFAEKNISPGMILSMKMESEGEEHNVPATVLAIDEQKVGVDFNHPLAGQEISYRITLLAIEAPVASSGCGCHA